MSNIKIKDAENAVFSEFIKKRNESRHRLNFLKKMGLIERTEGLNFKRASSYFDLKSAYSLIYRTFLSSGYLKPHSSGMRIREWELNKDMVTFIAMAAGNVVGSCSLAPHIDYIGLPADEIYREEIDRIRNVTVNINEACNIGVEESYRNRSIVIEFLRCVLAHCWYKKIEKTVAVVNKGHQFFYEFLLMRPIGPEKSYSADRYDPVILMCLDCELIYKYLSSPESSESTADRYLRDFLLFKNPYINLVEMWEKEAQETFQRQHINERFLEEMRVPSAAFVQNSTDSAPAGAET